MAVPYWASHMFWFVVGINWCCSSLPVTGSMSWLFCRNPVSGSTSWLFCSSLPVSGSMSWLFSTNPVSRHRDCHFNFENILMVSKNYLAGQLLNYYGQIILLVNYLITRKKITLLFNNSYYLCPCTSNKCLVSLRMHISLDYHI